MCGVYGSENRGRRQRDVSAVGTVSKAGRGRRKGEEGGGVFSGEGERTTETVSHTVPNMAAADQCPINRLAGTLYQTNKNPFLFLVFRGSDDENNNRLRLARPTLFTVLSTRRGGGSRLEGLEFASTAEQNKSPGGEIANPTRSVRTEILKS